MPRIIVLLALLVPTGNSFAQPVITEQMMTIPERTDYRRTSSVQEVVDVIDALASATMLMHRETLLVTREGRQVPLVILADPPLQTPEQAQASGKPVIYIQGNIHGGEVEGKEASLILMRDILYGDKQHLLENQILLFVPVYNADGNDDLTADSRPSQEGSPALAGQRAAHGYDLNRDGMIIEADETRALFERVLNRWDPDLLVDLHTTNGTWHGYSLTYAPSYHTAGDPATSEYTADIMLPSIQRAVKDKFDLDFNWYGGFDYRDWPPTELRTYHHAPRYLTNHMALRNRMAILSETFAHDRFDKRIHAANVFIEEILEYSHRHGDEIRQINRDADRRVAAGPQEQEKGVRYHMVARDEVLDLLSYRYIPYTTDDGSTAWARSAELVTIAGVANFNAFAPTLKARGPTAYIFSATFTGLADKLRQHGIEVDVLETDASFSGEYFVAASLSQQDIPQNGHYNSRLAGEFRESNRTFPRGDFIVPMQQRLANLAFYLLEPESDDGLVHWNLLDEYLLEQLSASGEAEYPVFKVLP